jgi:septum formation protein
MKPQNKKTKQFASLILASASVGRAQVLRKHSIEFNVEIANIEEESYRISHVDQLVRILAQEKAKTIRERYLENAKHSELSTSPTLILAVDTLVTIDGEIIGKPKDEHDAAAILKKLAGKTHRVISGVALWDSTTDQLACATAESFVTFRPLSAAVINDYIATGEPMGKAGGYASQGAAGHKIITKIDGDPTNVIGLPMQCFYELLDKLGWVMA